MDPPEFWPDCGTQSERDSINELLPGKLFLTNFRGSENREALLELGVTNIVRVNQADGCEEFSDFRYLCIDVEDLEDAAENLSKSFGEANDFILNAKGGVVVHCAAGISRSTTVVLAYLMKLHKMPLIDAFRLCYKARRVVWPNDGFMRALIKYEFMLFNKNTLHIEEYVAWGDYTPPEDTPIQTSHLTKSESMSPKILAKQIDRTFSDAMPTQMDSRLPPSRLSR
ncbi:hypothetical protein CYMTET_24135 [Cymbomonas tetramitiformis]|uniref:protein-tyrosine-phosphatase n=1 Tax=Cymbomonas tetramitiformis TaxID=36881 RepID=A0AAE0FX01_9CHLO|nr:hypothetical protein CYMTET_24135 [Cymbomonas tetramitiformis]